MFNPDREDLVSTRVINGTKFLLINVDSGLELNGIPLHFEE